MTAVAIDEAAEPAPDGPMIAVTGAPQPQIEAAALADLLDSAARGAEAATQIDAPPLAVVRVDQADLPLEAWEVPGRGSVAWKTLFSADRTATSDMTCGIAIFGPGDGLEPHRHAPPEIYFGIEGSGQVLVSGVEYRIAPGVALYIPGGAEHSVLADAGPLRFFYAFARDSFAGIDYLFAATTDSPAA